MKLIQAKRLLMVAVLVLGTGLGLFTVQASDHDDGELDLKGRALNLTDVYAFREDSQTGNPFDQNNLILVMNTHPRSLARQQYYYYTDTLRVRETGIQRVVFRFNS